MNSKRSDRSFNFNRSYRDERWPSRDSHLSTKSQIPFTSYEEVQSRYNGLIHFLSLPDIKFSIDSPFNPDFQLGSSPRRNNYTIKNKSNSLPRPNV